MFYLCSNAESMSLMREQLVRKALAALSEIADACPCVVTKGLHAC